MNKKNNKTRNYRKLRRKAKRLQRRRAFFRFLLNRIILFAFLRFIIKRFTIKKYFWITTDEFEVQFKIIQVFSSSNIEKIFLVKEFLQSYHSKISNSRIRDIKLEFIKWINLLTESNIIENNYKIIQKGQYHSTKELTINNISEGFILYEKITL